MSDLAELINRGFESKDLDYKGPVAWEEADKKACCELVKDVLAMANTKGGFIVIGVGEKDDGFEPVGLSPEQLATFDTTRINQFVQRYTDPPINTTLTKLPMDGKMFVIISIPAFTDTPHICQRDFPNVLAASTIYVRTDNNASAPVKSASDVRQIVARAVRGRQTELLAMVHDVMQGKALGGTEKGEGERFDDQVKSAIVRFDTLNPFKDKGHKGFVEFWFHPEQFHADRFSIDQLMKAAEQGCVDFKGWPFLFFPQNHIDKLVVLQEGIELLWPHRTHEMLDYWQFLQSGLFYQRKLLWEDTEERAKAMGKVVDFKYSVQFMVEAIHCLIRLYENLLEPSDTVFFNLRLTDTGNRELKVVFQTTPSLWMTDAVSKIPEITCARAMTLPEWSASPVDHAVGICKDVFVRFNWRESDEGEGIIRKIMLDTLNRRIT